MQKTSKEVSSNSNGKDYRIGYKVFSKDEDGLYSYGVAYFENNGQCSREVSKRFLTKYSSKRFVKGKPWIALFESYEKAKLYNWRGDVHAFVIKKVLYEPYTGNGVNIHESRNFAYYMSNHKNIKSFKTLFKRFQALYGFKHYAPDNTIFASKIKIIEED